MMTSSILFSGKSHPLALCCVYLYIAIFFFSSVARAGTDFDDYFWLPIEAPPHVIKAVDKTIQTCLSDAKEPGECIGIAVQSCADQKPQCYYLEAAGWELFGYGFFYQLTQALPNLDSLKESQNTWIKFARSECALTAAVYQKDPVLRSHETARCALVLTATRTLMLRALASDMNVHNPMR